VKKTHAVIVKHDPEANAIYIALDQVQHDNDGVVTKKLAPGVHGDYHTDRLIGIEVLALGDEKLVIEVQSWPKDSPKRVKREKRRR